MYFDVVLFLSAFQAHLAAEEAEWTAQEYTRKFEDQMRNMRRAGSIDVEAHWVADPLELPMTKETPCS